MKGHIRKYRFIQVASEAESLLVEKWREIEVMSKSDAASRHSDETQKAVAKLGKTLMKVRKVWGSNHDMVHNGRFCPGSEEDP